mgnify:FL=1|tara:strand:+ start:135 stop:710 length:576 start_codon:yes stop_codon:yes gene_type:complete
MTKKIVTVEAPTLTKRESVFPNWIEDINTAEIFAYGTAASKACTDDIIVGERSSRSGLMVAYSFDTLFTFDWTLFKGNGSKKTCLEKLGMDPDDFMTVKLYRDSYKKGWDDAGLPNFDRRWQYVVGQSIHTVAETEGDDSEDDSEKSDYDKCIKALENALRYATADEFTGNVKTADAIRAAQKLNGIDVSA